MGISRDEIIELASRYVTTEEITDFPFENDIFCMLIREIPHDKILQEEEGWSFRGYGICIGYVKDEESKPAGKWLWMHFVSLDTFPPAVQVLKLQPPHVVKGRFQNSERSHEIRILKISIGKMSEDLEKSNANENTKKAISDENKLESKIVKFRKKETNS